MRVLVAVSWLLAVAGCSESGSSAPRAAAPIGAACVECHAEIVDSYRTTGMARALGPVRAGELDGLAEVADAAGWRYRFEAGANGVRVVETVDVQGRALSSSMPIAFAIGGGILDRAFAAERGGRIWLAPLEVISSPRHAALAPGHAIQPGTRLTTGVTEECLSCHTDSLPPRDYPLNLVRGPWLPRGISCNACHGDGDAHAAWQKHALAGGKADSKDPVLAFGDAPLVERLSVCARCHLQGDARIALTAGERGVPPPGGDLLERRAVFVAAQPSDEIGFVSQVQRMVLSRCFVASLANPGKEMTCQTCHDPHRSTFEGAGRRDARDGCLKCHPGDGACSVPAPQRASLDCVDCHMRRTAPFDVAGVEIHDHDVQRRPPTASAIRELRVEESRGGLLARFAWPNGAPHAGADDPGLWLMGQLAAHHPDEAAALVDREPGARAAALPMYHHLRATLLERAKRLADAEAAYRRALALDPQQAESAVNLGALLGALGRPREGVAVLDDVVARHPAADGALRNRGVLKLQLGDGTGFAADLEAAFRLQPHAATARALAQHYRSSGDSARATEWRTAALRLDPRLPP